MKKNIFTFIICLITLSGYAQTVEYIGPRGSIHDDPANGIYVAPNGNDQTGNGSIGAPFKSISTALGKATSGATIILRSGTYSDGNEVRVRTPNITIKSRKGEWAFINLPFPANIQDQNDGRSAVRFDPNASGCKLQSLDISGGFYAVCTETKWDWGQADRSGASNIIIEDCKLHDSRYEVVKVKPLCNNITVRFCEIYNPGRAELGTTKWKNGEAHGEAIDNVNSHNMKVQNCYMHDLNIGLYAKGGATDILFENNRIENCLGAGIAVAFDTSPDFFDLTVNPNYYECIRTIVRNNLIINTGWEGIGFYASKDAEVYNNTVVNALCEGTIKYHSPIYFGLSYQDWDPKAGRPANVNPSFHHNIVSQPSTSKNLMIDIRYSNDLGGMSALSGKPTMHDNCYYIAGKSATFSDNRPGSILSNASLAAWKTHISGENGTVEVNPSLNADYVTTNTQCTGMGIQFALKINPTANDTPTLFPETVASIHNGTLFIANESAETVQAFSTAGVLLFHFQKAEGKVGYPINLSKGTPIIVCGSSGWTKKLFCP